MTLDIKAVIGKRMNKSKFNQNFMQTLLLLSPSLFESIESLFEFPVVTRSWVFNTLRYSHVYFFVQRAIEISSNDIDMVKVPV